MLTQNKVIAWGNNNMGLFIVALNKVLAEILVLKDTPIVKVWTNDCFLSVPFKHTLEILYVWSHLLVQISSLFVLLLSNNWKLTKIFCFCSFVVCLFCVCIWYKKAIFGHLPHCLQWNELPTVVLMHKEESLLQFGIHHVHLSTSEYYNHSLHDNYICPCTYIINSLTLNAA